MSKKLHITALYTAAHLIVDFCTVNLVLSLLRLPGVSLSQHLPLIILYNFIAFAGQLPLGILADHLNKNSLFAACGCLTAAAAYALTNAPAFACGLAALGNAMFHLGGGINVLNISEKKSSLPGVFVSSGAVGLWLANRYTGKSGLILPPVLLLFCAAALIYLSVRNTKQIPLRHAAFRPKKPEGEVLFAGTCFLLTVVLRSYIGMILDFSWKTGLYSFLFVLAVASGKALGGILADRFGPARLSGTSLLAVALLFLFSFRIPAAGIAAVFLFNMTMPITLTAAADLCRGRNGTAFGLTTLALFIGFVPTLFSKTTLFSPAGLAAGAFVSALILGCGFMLTDKE